jgi:hypothetical protein
MLAALERCVTDLSGTYAMEDTDSMAIVATASGGEVSLPKRSGRRQKPLKGVRALSWAQVQTIADRFVSLNPYERSIAPGSILKIENDNYDPETKKQRQLWCYAIAAKRYALFRMDAGGAPTLLRMGDDNDTDRWSEHGLGHLLNPTDPDRDDREWTGQAWLRVVRRAGSPGFRVRLRGPARHHAP